MEIKSHFDHVNFNVTDLDRSIKFYKEALGLVPVGEVNHPEGAFKLVYLSRPGENFRLELTWLRDHPQPYELGENESHLAMRVEGDYDKIREYHRQMGCICFENVKMGLYFIHDPDDYWIEILKWKEPLNQTES
ncbi:MAG: VOC family protein [Muribaculaceae bacterium]|nr:VOC family protein [Muribaculaceae bacterium]